MLKPGPILPIQDAAAERFVIKSCPSSDNRIIPALVINI